MKRKKTTQPLVSSDELINDEWDGLTGKPILFPEEMVTFFDNFWELSNVDFNSENEILRIQQSFEEVFENELNVVVAKELIWLVDCIKVNDWYFRYSRYNYIGDKTIKKDIGKILGIPQVVIALKKYFQFNGYEPDDFEASLFVADKKLMQLKKTFLELKKIQLKEKFRSYETKPATDSSVTPHNDIIDFSIYEREKLEVLFPEIREIEIVIKTNCEEVVTNIKKRNPEEEGIKTIDAVRRLKILVKNDVENKILFMRLLKGITNTHETPVVNQSVPKSVYIKGLHISYVKLIEAILKYVQARFAGMNVTTHQQIVSWILAESDILMNKEVFRKVYEITESESHKNGLYNEYLRLRYPIDRLRDR